MQEKKHIYIPIEILVREINPKILFAFKAACKDYRVYIGSKVGIDMILNQKIKNQQQSGIFFYKSQIISNQRYIDKIKKACEKFIVLDEELGVGVANINSALERRAINLESTDKFFVIGKKMFNQLVKFNSYFKKISKISGWLKYDIYRGNNLHIYDEEIKKIKKNYGEYYLFSSNYGALSSKGLLNRMRSWKGKKLKFEKKRKSHFKNSISDFIFLKKILSKFLKKNPNFKLIIRPHPSDQLKSDWKFFEKFKNVNVVLKYDIIPWIISSKALIHRGCTSAIDSLILKKPTYFLLPNRNIGMNEKNLTFKLSTKIRNFDYVNKNTTRKRVLKKFVYDEIEFKKPAYTTIINEINNLKVKKEKQIRLNYIRNFLIYLIPAIGNFKTFVKKSFFNYKIIADSKMPGFLKRNEIIKKIESINDRKVKIKVIEVSREVFEIEKL